MCEYNGLVEELDELLDISEEANADLAAENSDLKDILIGTLLELNEFKDMYIADLEDELDFIDEVMEDDEDFCDCCCDICGELLH